MPISTTPFDPADYINSREDAVAYLNEALSTGNAAFIADALGVLARAKGMTEVAAKAGLGRESLYKSLKEGANPRFDTVLKVMDALEMRFSVASAKEPQAA
jgi:probable addiction module antidote protein